MTRSWPERARYPLVCLASLVVLGMLELAGVAITLPIAVMVGVLCGLLVARR